MLGIILLSYELKKNKLEEYEYGGITLYRTTRNGRKTIQRMNIRFLNWKYDLFLEELHWKSKQQTESLERHKG